MAISLSHLIIHQLKKNSEGELCVQFRKELLPNSTAAEEFINDLHSVYGNRASKGFGQFAHDSVFANLLLANRRDELDFLAFSEQSTEMLKQELSKYSFASEGVLVLAQYRALATDYLFIALLESRSSMKITDNLDLSSTQYLDVSKMDIVARVDLTTWETTPESNRYLTYVKGRVGRKVADFFLDFMQAQVGLDAKQQNQVLLEAVEDYYTSSEFEMEDKQQGQKQIFDYCKAQVKAGEELQIKDLAEVLPKDEQGDFYQFVEKQGYQLAESFPVDKTAIRKLTKFVGSGGGLSVNFDNLLLGERVFYDEQTDTLTIKGTPPNLRDQLKRYLTIEN